MEGKSLGPYRIVEKLGEGGMGEVWLAEDSRLGRKVAIKVLPPQFAADAERLGRFEQEARAAAALNHPHIAAVHDVGFEDGVHFMVQEYLEGQTLREALESGAMPLARALTIGAEIAEALAAAHRAGVVHRDLKPDNVFVTVDGHSKVLDFGLAKLTELAAISSPGATMSPTILGTSAGAVMGTAGYMAPEQVQAGAVDGRTDLFALGVVLYEAVTGGQPFAGRTVHHTLDRILSEEPLPLQEVSAAVPDRVEWVIQKCLQKDPVRRYQHADDLAVDLRAAAAEPGSPRQVPTPAAAGSRLATLVPWGVALLATAAALAAWGSRSPAVSSAEVARFQIAMPPGEGPTIGSNSNRTAVSPDGRRVAYVTDSALYVHDIAAGEAVRVPSSLNAQQPFFSPDSRSIGFFIGRELMVADLAGAPPIRRATVPDASDIRGAAWGEDGSIVLGNAGNDETSGLFLVPADGGEPYVLTAPPELGASYRYPQFLPGGRRILLTLEEQTSDNLTEKVLGVYSLDDDTVELLEPRGTRFQYSLTGHLVYGRGQNLLAAVPFDIDSMAVTGPEVVVLDDVELEADVGSVEASLGAGGNLVFAPSVETTGWLAWIDGAGEITRISEERAAYRNPRLAPDGQRLTVDFDDDLWFFDLRRGVFDRLAMEGFDTAAEWSPDGSRITYATGRTGRWGYAIKSSNDRGEGEGVLDLSTVNDALVMHPDGETMVFSDKGDIWTRSVDGDVLRFSDTPAREIVPRFSPDGRWVCFVSNEQGSDHVYVEEFPGPGRRWLVSPGGGSEPMWAPDGSRLVYRLGREFFEVAVDADDADAPFALPDLLFEAEVLPGFFGAAAYDVAADGRILALVGERGISASPNLNVILNFAAELERLVPTGR